MKKPDCCTYCPTQMKHDCRLQDICAEVKARQRRAAEALLDNYTFEAIERVRRLNHNRRRNIK